MDYQTSPSPTIREYSRQIGTSPGVMKIIVGRKTPRPHVDRADDRRACPARRRAAWPNHGGQAGRRWASFRRISFTPTFCRRTSSAPIYNPKEGTFAPRKGPVFTGAPGRRNNRAQ